MRREQKACRLVDELALLLRRPPEDVRALYDRLAPRYDDFRSLWLALAGGEAEEALLDDVRATLRPGARVLDAGTGTGTVARAIYSLEPAAQITMLDLSLAMLERARDVPGTRVVGDVLDLPFLDDEFDVVTSAWVIETVSDPTKAVSEYLRVLAPDGHVLYTFCSLPEGWLSQAGSSWLRSVVESRFGGTFLPPERTPWHDCNRSHRASFRRGLTTEVALRKCCSVGGEILPPGAHGPDP